jgi:2-aminoadipate transaminase
MKWATRFATRTQRMRRSAVRELLKVTAQPDMISFAGGLPAPELFPMEEIRAASEAVLTRQGRRALQYGETEGTAELRDWLARRYSTSARLLTRENVVITSGAQQALDLLGRILLNDGDRVIVENPTYLALLSAWRPLGVGFVPAPGDESGLCVHDLEPQFAQRPKLLYVIPNFQNPRGTTLVSERRAELVEQCRANGIGVTEDDPYSELRYEGERLPSLLELDSRLACGGPDWNVIHTGTFSKVLGPGLRLGWVVAPESVIEKLVLAKQTADLHTSTLNQLIAAELLHRGILEHQVPRLRVEYRRRRDAMLAAMVKHFPDGVTWTRPAGGMFLLVTLPEGADAEALLPAALDRRVAFVPGEEFHLIGCGKNTLRLNFSHSAPELIEEGIRRLSEVLCTTGLFSRLFPSAAGAPF